jgi:hypothetical protein
MIVPFEGFFGVKGVVIYLLYPLPTSDHRKRKDEEMKRKKDEGYLSWFWSCHWDN